MTPRCGECGSNMTTVGTVLFCTLPRCSMYGRGVDPAIEPLLPIRLLQQAADNAIRTETGAQSRVPALVAASPETREPCVASVAVTTRLGARPNYCDRCHDEIAAYGYVVLRKDADGVARMYHESCDAACRAAA
ncbi:MAG: hypothetical protein C0499_02640 [Zymomonas sp.]|nr:hypothetical protein [Zymomonas sp.]